MTRKINYEEVLAFRAPSWAKAAADDMRGPGEQRSDVLRDIALPVLLEHAMKKGMKQDETEEEAE